MAYLAAKSLTKSWLPHFESILSPQQVESQQAGTQATTYHGTPWHAMERSLIARYPLIAAPIADVYTGIEKKRLLRVSLDKAI